MEPLSTTKLKSGLADHPDAGGTRLHGRWLLLARVLWLAIFVLMLVVFCANLAVGNYGLAITILLIATTSMWFSS